MTAARFHFNGFELDPANRQLKRGDKIVELSARYLDALTLLVGEQGRLVSKDRFLAEVWSGVPVTDEALTQCIKTLRRQLGDDAANPRFIETVPKHGYRFVAPVDTAAGKRPKLSGSWSEFLLLALAGTVGGGMAGLIGGLVYGFAASAQPQPGMGAASVLLVILCLSIATALMGAAGVSLGIAAGAQFGGPSWRWTIAGGALGGLVVGAAVKLLGLDAFNLLFGRSPVGIAGAAEGAILGATVGLGLWLATRGQTSLRRGVSYAALTGGAGGIAIGLLGGRLMAGSLDLLARTFPGSRLSLGQIGALLGEPGFGPVSRTVTGGLEAALFSACIVGAMLLARRQLAGKN